jgi:ethylmalonyl-CoA/methylmalonyl-CoA decarboxylase
MREVYRDGGAGGVRLEFEGPVARLILDNVASRNAVTPAMMAALADAVDALEAFDGVGLVLAGAGGTFCAGADLSMVAAGMDAPDSGAAMSTFMVDLTARIHALPLVSVAAIEGYAIGGGAELVTCCDFRVMATDATVRFVHATLGLSPGWGGGGRLTRLVGRRRALRLLAGAERLGAQRALDWGVADALTPPGGAEAAALSMVAELGALPAASVRGAKALVHAADTLDAAGAAAVELETFGGLWGNPAQRAAIARMRRVD